MKGLSINAQTERIADAWEGRRPKELRRRKCRQERRRKRRRKKKGSNSWNNSTVLRK